jgi:hypothetical protein
LYYLSFSFGLFIICSFSFCKGQKKRRDDTKAKRKGPDDTKAKRKGQMMQRPK